MLLQPRLLPLSQVVLTNVAEHCATVSSATQPEWPTNKPSLTVHTMWPPSSLAAPRLQVVLTNVPAQHCATVSG